TKPGLEKVWALRIKKGCVSVLTQPHFVGVLLKVISLIYSFMFHVTQKKDRSYCNGLFRVCIVLDL
ncbi:hypothetical protein, partial [uncultured Bacteroides sp.]|uniref:hypothetical protein n=1 Tax=uncultured Bacteroides sp. TaxID=162156 RepID=UPI0025DBF373